ncbi:MAG: hypothetical protein IJ834_05325 [Paludibacteraceae bacterium]|nr:hypothetical protein [Paludibacteraceae bacterium]
MKPYKVQYQEVDGNRRLRLYTLENMLLNSAGSNADDTGIGIQYLLEQNCTWVITNMSLEIRYLPTHGERIGIETWVENAAHMLSVRNFRIYLLDSEGEIIKQIGQAKSVWAVINITDRTIQNVFEQQVFIDYHYGPALPIGRAPRFHVIDMPDGEDSHKIVYSDIDYNGHCNSCKYVEFMLNACEPVALKQMLPQSAELIDDNSKTLRIDIKYAKEMYKGEVSKIKYQHIDESTIQYEVRNSAGELACNARIGIS